MRNKKWYEIHYKGYCFYVWWIWLAPFVIGYDKFRKRQWEKLIYSDKKAKKFLDKVLPRLAEHNDEEGYYYVQIPKWDWIPDRIIPRHYRMFNNKFRYSISDYLINFYERENSTKKVEFNEDFIIVKFLKKTLDKQ